MGHYDFSRRQVLKGAMGASAALALASCSKGSGGTSGNGPIRIGVLVELSGPLAPYGKSIDRSARLAVGQINKAGGVLGRKFEVTTVDTGTSAAKATDLAKQLVLRDKVDMVIGPAGSDENDAAARVVAEQHKQLYFFTEGYEGGKCAPTYFSFSNVPEQQRPFVEFLQETAGKRALLFGADYIWPHSVFASLKKQINAQGGQLVDEVYLPTVADDFTQLVSRVKKAKPDYVYCLYPAVFGAALTAMSDAGLIGEFALGTSFVSDSLLGSLGPAADGMYGYLSYSTAIPTDPAREFKKAFQDAYGPKNLPGANESVSTFNSIYLYKQALEAAGTTSPGAVSKALVGQSYSGPTGEVVMTDSHACKQSATVVKAKDGRYEFIKMVDALEPGTQGPCD